MSNNTFCSMLWHHTMVDTDGSVKPCCIFEGTIKKDDGTPFNFGSDDIDDIFLSNSYQEIRNDMIAGKEVSGCQACYKIEKYGGRSNRISSNEKWNQINGSSTPKITYIDLRTGNLCNLACRSCSPSASSTLGDEIKQNKKLQFYFDVPEKDLTSWYNTDIFRSNFEKISQTADSYYFTGGEPTINERTMLLLEELVSNDKADVLLIFNTNLTNINNRFYSLLKKFSNVVLFVSVDGVGKLQEYLRYPSKWSAIEANFMKLLALGDKINIIITPVIQISNLGKCVELFEYADHLNDLSNRNAVTIAPIDLRYPDRLDIVNLPAKYKQHCWEKIQHWISTTKHSYPQFEERIESVKNKCLDSYSNLDMLTDYMEFNLAFDSKRNMSLIEVNPELAELLNDPSLWN